MTLIYKTSSYLLFFSSFPAPVRSLPYQKWTCRSSKLIKFWTTTLRKSYTTFTQFTKISIEVYFYTFNFIQYIHLTSKFGNVSKFWWWKLKSHHEYSKYSVILNIYTYLERVLTAREFSIFFHNQKRKSFSIFSIILECFIFEIILCIAFILFIRNWKIYSLNQNRLKFLE